MRRRHLQVSFGCILLIFGLLVASTTGASAASKEKVIYSFQGGTDGANPFSDLVVDAKGNLYGTTAFGGGGNCNQGCGTVFELMHTKDGWKEQVIFAFGSGNAGGIPVVGLTFDDAGNFYGIAYVVFELSPNGHGGWTENTLYSFGEEGIVPGGDLAFDDQGNLYGTSVYGGSGGTSCNEFGCGFVFELSPQADGTWTESTIHIFYDNGSDGVVPSSGVVLDSSGDVYGMTQNGGSGSCLTYGPYKNITGCGVVYELTPNSGGGWTETIPYNFVRGAGSAIYPAGGLLFDKSGRMYGMSLAGGDGFGTVFQLRKSQEYGWQQTQPHIFFGPPDGTPPTQRGSPQALVGKLAIDAEGDLFGTTPFGGADGDGIVFELLRSKEGWKEKILHSFSAGTADGANPQAGVVPSNGHLYGTTLYGGSANCTYNYNVGCGVVYEVTP